MKNKLTAKEKSDIQDGIKSQVSALENKDLEVTVINIPPTKGIPQIPFVATFAIKSRRYAASLSLGENRIIPSAADWIYKGMVKSKNGVPKESQPLDFPTRESLGIPEDDFLSFFEIDKGGPGGAARYGVIKELNPIIVCISLYELKKQEHKRLKDTLGTPESAKALGNILAGILDNIGYTVTIKHKEYYFQAPTSMNFVGPVFTLGLQKEVLPIKTDEAYETTLIYLSYKKPQSKTQIQLKFFGDIPGERIKEIQRSFKGHLTAYGLKCLYLVIEECSRNQRSPWFVLDINKCLDLMGYKRTKRGPHHSATRKKLLAEFNALTKINFNIERREPRGENKDKVIKIASPLLSITGKFEEWEVEKGEPIESGILIKDNIQIFIHPEIFKYINNWYTIIPETFLRIDAGNNPQAILLYSYIANQWRIGWSQNRGTIKQPMHQILDGSGLGARLPQRRNQQVDFVNKIKDSLQWLKRNKAFWIKSVKFDAGNKTVFNQSVTITASEDHPLRTSMKKQIKTG